MNPEKKLKIERAFQTWDFEVYNLPAELEEIEVNAKEFLEIIVKQYIVENDIGRNYFSPKFVPFSDGDITMPGEIDYQELLENKIKRYKTLVQHYKEYRNNNKPLKNLHKHL